MLSVNKKGFTLVELLIVIAILAVLAAAVVIVLNPGELLAQARDSQRLSDMDTLKNALAVYVAQVSPIELGACPSGGRATEQPGAGLGPFAADVSAGNVSTTNTVTGGWVDVNLSTVPGGSPIPFYPVDPTNSTTYFYAYACDDAAGSNYTFELDARLESQKHRPKMETDGGNRNTCSPASWTAATCFYEVGTAPGLAL
jgi:type IV pilus assembly protein PilA